MAAAIILKKSKNRHISAAVWPISTKFDTVMQFRHFADANWDSGDEWKVKLKREVELMQYGGLLFHAAGTGFVRYYTVSQKKGATLTMAITLSVLDRFAKFFHCCKEQ